MKEATMKFHIRNLGPIRDAEVQLKPLTIFIGPNNAGKTWLAYAIASIFSPYTFSHYVYNLLENNQVQKYPFLLQVVDEVFTKGFAKLDIRQFADECIAQYVEDITNQAKADLSRFLGTTLVSFQDTDLTVNISDIKSQFLKTIVAKPIKMTLGRNSSGNIERKALLAIEKKAGERQINLYTSEEETSENILAREIIEERILRGLLSTLGRAIYPDVSFFPVERGTLITFPFQAARKKKIEESIEESQERDSEPITGKPLSTPIANFLDSMVRIRRISSDTENLTRRNKEKSTSQYIVLADLLETTILSGKVNLGRPEPMFAQEVVFQPQQIDQPMEISLTSSMVKELSSLVFYLRHFARPDELIVIDEPEMNLHPLAQTQMLEFLAMIVNAGLHVLITTHSPYIIDHLTNIMLAYEHEDKENIRQHFFLNDTQAFIAKKKVAAYLVDKGTVTNALDDEQDWDTFGKVSDRISEIYFKL